MLPAQRKSLGSLQMDDFRDFVLLRELVDHFIQEDQGVEWEQAEAIRMASRDWGDKQHSTKDSAESPMDLWSRTHANLWSHVRARERIETEAEADGFAVPMVFFNRGV